MAHGPAPKDPSKRARQNKESQMRVIAAEPAKQPKLPTRMPDGTSWPARTKAWWRMWGDSPLSVEFTANDWSELLDAALLHADFWLGNTKVAPELRLRVAKFGATPEDRARLRIQFAHADEAETKHGSHHEPSTSRQRRGSLKALPDAQ